MNGEEKRKRKKRKQKIIAILLTVVVAGTVLLPVQPVRAETWAQYLARQWAACETRFAAIDKESGLPKWNGGTTEAVDADGDGLVEITTPEQFCWAVTNLKSLKLLNDIDLGGTAGQLWTPVNVGGTDSFIVDGNGCTIYNLKVSAPSNAGLFATVENPNFVMKNLSFRYAEIRRSVVADNNRNYAVSIANFRRGTIEDVSVEDSLVQGNRFAAGLVVGWDTGRKAFDESGNVYTDLNNTLGTIINRCHTARVYTYGTWCIGNFAAPLMGSRVTNSYAVDGISVSTAGHSGGFISCPGYNYVENCFCNITMYGESATAVFSGVAHTSNKYVNCYASGVVEGETNVGGFVGDGSNSATSYNNYYENCYSTTMVGMQNQASNMGGFVGYDPHSHLHMTNCYSAGEVGALTTNPATSGSVGGFGGVISTTYNNCYYDMQTSAMRNRVVGNSTSRSDIIGKQTSELLGQLPSGFATDTWSAQDGLYPQLNVFCDDAMLAANFSERDRAIVKAYSAASVCTAMLYPSNNPEYTDETNYDTVRSIQYLFPLTNNAMVSNPQFDISWVADDIKSTVPGMEALPVITLNKQTYAVASLAPGIGWTTVYVKYYPNPQDKSNYVTGTRRLRLVPTTTLSVATSAGVDHVIYTVPEGARPLSDTYTRYDHRAGVFFSKGDATQLNNGNLTSDPFPADNENFENVNLSTVGGYVNVTVAKEKDGKWENLTLTDDLKELLLSERDAEREDLGRYRLTYSWYSSGSSAGGAHLESVKYLTVRNSFKVTYMRNDRTDKVHYADPGAYVEGDSVGSYLPEDPVRTGYTFAGWYIYTDEDTSIEFDATTSLHDDTVVYAAWKADKHTIIFKLDDDSGDIYIKEIQETDETVQLPENPKKPGYSFIGWSTEPDADEPNFDPDKPLLDEDLTFYAVWKRNPVPEFTKEVVNQSEEEEGIVRVQDVLTYTLTARNTEDDSEWVDVIIKDTLPAGVTLLEDSIWLKGADGTRVQLESENVYNNSSRVLEVPVGTIKGGEQYIVTFDVFVNGSAIDADTPENHDITNVASANGSNPDGSDSDVTSQPVLPDGGDDIQIGNPDPQITKTVRNRNRAEQEAAYAGDVLVYTITISNPLEGTLWKNVVVRDVLPQGLKLNNESIWLQAPDGSRKQIEASQVYNTQSRTIEVSLSDIAGGEAYILNFDVVLEEGMEDRDIGNMAMAGGQKPDGTGTGWTETEKVYPEGWNENGMKPEVKVIQSEIKTPKTGDDSNPIPWMVVMAIAMTGTCYLLLTHKQKKNRR